MSFLSPEARLRLLCLNVFPREGDNSPGNRSVSHHIFEVQPRPVNVENRLEPGLSLAPHLLSEDSGAKQTDVSSGVLPRQVGKAEVRGMGAAHSVKPKPGQAASPRGSLAPQRAGVASGLLPAHLKMTQEAAKTGPRACGTWCRKQMSAPRGWRLPKWARAFSIFWNNYVFKLNLRHRGGVGGLSIGKIRRTAHIFLVLCKAHPHNRRPDI